MDQVNEMFDSPFFMKNLQDTLWKMEKDYGSPKIRWQTDHENTLTGKYHRSNYNSFTNTINFAVEDVTGDFFETFVSEVTHSKQFDQQPLSSYVSAAVDCGKTLFTSIVSDQSFAEEYLKLYEQEGTLEHDAHTILETPLLEQAWTAASGDIDRRFKENK